MADVVFDPDWEEQALQATKPAMRRIQEEAFKDMLAIVPRDTGELADSGKAYITSGHRYRIKFGTDHWAPQEYGTKHQTAQSFMRPAVYRKRSL